MLIYFKAWGKRGERRALVGEVEARHSPCATDEIAGQGTGRLDVSSPRSV